MKPALVREAASTTTKVVKVRREQADAVAQVLDDVRIAEELRRQAQVKADHLCAGVLAGLVPIGSGVLSVDVRSCRLTIQVDGDAPST